LDFNTYLNIGVLRDELDEPLKAIKEIGCETKQGFHCFVVLVGFFHLAPVVFKNYSDELDKSN
jgi:hypothetical protein